MVARLAEIGLGGATTALEEAGLETLAENLVEFDEVFGIAGETVLVLLFVRRPTTWLVVHLCVLVTCLFGHVFSLPIAHTKQQTPISPSV